MTKVKKKFTPLVRLIDWVWRDPKGKLTAKVKDACDNLPHRKRLMVVTAMSALFLLAALFAVGHACYRLGARQAYSEYEVQHMYSIELPTPDEDYHIDKKLRYEEMEKELTIQNDTAYDVAGMESED